MPPNLGAWCPRLVLGAYGRGYLYIRDKLGIMYMSFVFGVNRDTWGIMYTILGE